MHVIGIKVHDLT